MREDEIMEKVETYERPDHYNPAESSEGVYDFTGHNFLRKSFLHMTLGILVTAVVALYLLFVNHRLLYTAVTSLTLVAVVQLGVVIILSFMIRKLSAVAATLLFYLYAALTGVTFAAVGAVYSVNSIIYTLLITLAIFITLSVYGYMTKEDLQGYVRFFFIGLVALVLVSVFNLWFKVPALYWAGTVGGIAIFTLLIAYDVNRIKRWSYELMAEDPSMAKKMGIIGALELYLDFVNLFLYLLRIFGRRKN